MSIFDKTKEPEETISKPERVEIVNNNGVIARPFESDIQPWLDQGWKRVNKPDTIEVEDIEDVDSE